MASKHAYEEYSDDAEREMDHAPPRAGRVGFAERVTTVADDTDGSRDGAPDDTAVDAELADDGPDDFDMNPFTLMFKDSDAEAGYVRFITGQAYFAAGKLYTFIAGFFMVFLIIPFLRWRPAWSDFNDAFVLVMVGGAVTAFASFGLLFVSAAPRWREVLFTFVVATHWGSLGTTSVRKKEDEVYRYGITTVCLFYCCFLAQPRFILVFIFLVVLSTIAIAAVTFGSEEYFKHHTYFEVLYWPILLAMFPIHILRKFEMRSRAAYQASEMTRAFLRGLARRSKAMYRIIARSYPVSAAMRVLDSRGSTNYALYPNTALVVTDVQGFTAWASVTSSDAVVKGISKMFIAMEQEALKFAVEKISTVGDSFVGAVFPPRNSHSASVAGNGSGTVSPRQPRSPGMSTTSPHLHAAAKASPSAVDHEMKRFPSAGDSVGGDGGYLHDQQTQEDMYDTATRCHRALRFAHAVRHHPHVMTIRIGVHIGAVVGGFVGLQPPKFDVFGQGIKIAQELEHNGQPNRIHASRQILDAAALVGFPSDDHTTTPLGVLFSAWRLRDPRAHAVEAARLAEGTVAVEKNAMLLCALVARSSEALYARTMRNGDTRDAATRERLRTLAAGATRAIENGPGLDMSSAHPSLMGSVSSVALNEHTDPDDTAAAAVDAEDTSALDAASGNVIDNAAGVEKLFVFSIFTLTFADDEAEQAYRAWYLETGLATVIFSSLTCMFTYLLVAHVCTACTGTALDKLAIIIAAAILLAYLTFLREKGTAHGHNPKIGAAVYLAVFYTLALLYQPGGCAADDAGVVDPKAPGNSIMVMGVIPAAAMMLCLELSLIARAVAHTLMCGQLVLVVFVRHLIYGSDEGVLQYDVFPFVVFASLILMSYFTDFNLRLAFQDESRQSALEALERSSADLCNAALEMLLPNFVVERLVRESAFDTATTADGDGVDGTTDENRSLLAPRRRGSAAQRSDAGHDDDDERRSQSVRSTGRPESSAGRASSRHSRRSRLSKSRSVGTTTLFGGSATNSLWPFQRAVVLFVSFEPPTLRYNAVRDTVARIEVAARARGLQKVKTIGTMVLLVAGAEDDTTAAAALPAGEVNDPWQPSQRVAETAINVAEAAIEIRRHAFVNTGLEAAGWKVQIGIHAGPLFGAVIGSQGLAFDIYGDTVNTASRMCTTAKVSASGAGNDSIQCSESFFADIPYEATAGFVGFAAERRPDPVAVKGKGMMTVYRLFERTAATSVTPIGSTPALTMSPAANHSAPATPIMLLGTPQARSTSPHQSLRSPRSPLAAAASGSGRTADDDDDIDDVEALTSAAVPVEPDPSVPGAVAQA